MRAGCWSMDVVTGDVEANLAAAKEGVDAAAAARLSLVGLPEMWPTSFVPDAPTQLRERSDRAVEELAEHAAGLGVSVFGSAWGPDVGGRPTNRAHVLVGGTVKAHHDKVHLFSPTAEHLSFAAGDAPPPVVQVGGAAVAPIVCYDLRFPDVARAAVRAGAEVLLVCAQWPASRAAHWAALVAGRAAEGQCHVVACNRSGEALIGRRRMSLTFAGNSLVVGPDGVVLARGEGGARLIASDLDPNHVDDLRQAVPVSRDERTDVVRGW